VNLLDLEPSEEWKRRESRRLEGCLHRKIGAHLSKIGYSWKQISAAKRVFKVWSAHTLAAMVMARKFTDATPEILAIDIARNNKVRLTADFEACVKECAELIVRFESEIV
jgi:hypothetical protein